MMESMIWGELGIGRIFNGTERLLTFSLLLSNFSVDSECDWFLAKLDEFAISSTDANYTLPVKEEILMFRAVHNRKVKSLISEWKGENPPKARIKRSSLWTSIFEVAAFVKLNTFIDQNLFNGQPGLKYAEEGHKKIINDLVLYFRTYVEDCSDRKLKALTSVLFEKKMTHMQSMLTVLRSQNVGSAKIDEISVADSQILVKMLCKYYSIEGSLRISIPTGHLAQTNGTWIFDSTSAKALRIGHQFVDKCSKEDSLDQEYFCNAISQKKLYEIVQCCTYQTYMAWYIVVINEKRFPGCQSFNSSMSMQGQTLQKQQFHLRKYILPFHALLDSVDVCQTFSNLYQSNSNLDSYKI